MRERKSGLEVTVDVFSQPFSALSLCGASRGNLRIKQVPSPCTLLTRMLPPSVDVTML